MFHQFRARPPFLSAGSISQRSEGLAPKKVDNLKIYKVNPQTTQPKRKRRITEDILPNLYCSVKKPIPYKEFQQKLVEQLIDMKSDPQILKVLAGSDSDSCKTSTSQFRTVPVRSSFSYQQKIVQSDSDIIINNPDEVIFLKNKITTTT